MSTWWSELPGSRTREVIADVATLLWIVAWIRIGWWLYGLLAQFARAGAAVQTAGASLEAVGQQIADVLARLPLIGEATAENVRLAFAATASPLIGVGSDLARFVMVVTTLLVLIVTAAPLALWLQRFLPWRLRRLRARHAAHRALRTAPALEGGQVERLLATRAISRLPYEELLRHTPDPLGDWTAGRYERLARAELASVGLRPWPGVGRR